MGIELDNPCKGKVKVNIADKYTIMDRKEILDLFAKYSAEDVKKIVIEKIISK
jgi:hypothetical protein